MLIHTAVSREGHTTVHTFPRSHVQRGIRNISMVHISLVITLVGLAIASTAVGHIYGDPIGFLTFGCGLTAFGCVGAFVSCLTDN